MAAGGGESSKELDEALFFTSFTKLLHAVRSATLLPGVPAQLAHAHAWVLAGPSGFRPAGPESQQLIKDSRHLVFKGVRGKILVETRLRQATTELSTLLVRRRSAWRTMQPPPPPTPLAHPARILDMESGLGRGAGALCQPPLVCLAVCRTWTQSRPTSC